MTNPPTYFKASTGSYSAIDSTLSDPLNYMDYIWKVHNNPCASEHFPIMLENIEPIHDNNRPPCWKTNKANLQQFKTLYNRRLVQDPNSRVLMKHFTETLIENETILSTCLKCLIKIMLKLPI